MKILAIDVGQKNLGFAVSDDGGTIALPLMTVRRESLDKDIDRVRKIVEERRVGEIVVGLPRNMDGTEGKQAQKVAKFVKSLRKKIDLAVHFWDERLTTMAANKVLIEGRVRRQRRKLVVDKLAAVLILQGYLDSKTHAS
jgi:putative Holliday junction resolvase